MVQKNVPLRQRGDVTVNVTTQAVSSSWRPSRSEAAPVAVQFNTAMRDLTMEQKVIRQLPLSDAKPGHAGAARSVGQRRRSTVRQNFDHYAANAYDIGGTTAGQNDVLIDGSPLTNSSKLGYNPPVDAVAEYTVVQNASTPSTGTAPAASSPCR